MVETFDEWFAQNYPHLDKSNFDALTLKRFEGKFENRDKYKAYQKAYYEANKKRVWGVGK